MILESNAAMDFLSQRRSCSDYVHALEEELKKIEVFQRELPLCLQLVTQAIKNVKEEMKKNDDDGRPVLEEFIPLKPTSSSSPEAKMKKSSPADEMPDWLRSVQLRNLQDTETAAADITEGRPKKSMAANAKGINGGAFHFFERDVALAAPPAAATNSSTGCGGGDGAAVREEKKEKEGQPRRSHRKARRNWSPELHCRFQHALEQLGGSHVATPKQIRELMKVESLTNGEVKSHLQKFRLHNRRQSSVVQSSGAPPPVHQLVVVGGLWVPPLGYSWADAAGVRSAAAEVYSTPLATTSPLEHLRLQQQQQQQEKLLKLGCYGDAGVEVTPTNSCSSTQTTIASLRS